jgi:hypothetical protein
MLYCLYYNGILVLQQLIWVVIVQFLSRELDRVLTNQETHLMLLEEAISEDVEISKLMFRWHKLLSQIKFSRKQSTGDGNKIRVKAWKYGEVYCFKNIHDAVVSTQNFVAESHGIPQNQCWLAIIPGKKQLEGISIAEIEEVADKFYLSAHPIKVLLDSGFQLDLVVYQEFFNSLVHAI